MDDNERLRWLQQALDATTDDEIYCDEAQEWLDQLVEDELRGRPDAQPIYARVRQHIKVCPECAADYQFIRENMAELIDAGLPDYQQAETAPTSNPFAGLTAVPDLTVVHPNLLPTIEGWRGQAPILHTGASRGAETRPKGLDSLAPVDLTINGHALSFVLVAEETNGRFELSGNLEDAPRTWRNQPIRLYKLAPPVFYREAQLGIYCSFEFADVAPGAYLFTLIPEETEVPLVLIELTSDSH